MKIIVIILNLVLISCVPINQSHNIANVENQVLQSTFEMYVDSISLNLHHNKTYFDIEDRNSTKRRKNNEEINENSNNFPYYKEIISYVEEQLNNNGYKKHNESKRLSDSLLPINISYTYMHSDDKPLLLLSLQAGNFTLKTSAKHELLTYRKAFGKKVEYRPLDILPLWRITLGVEGEIPMNEEFILIKFFYLKIVI